jgi:threonine/homoserine/homoserine lactone efflux protein
LYGCALPCGGGSTRSIAAAGVLNPHTALFFFAFLPQFVNPSKGGVPLQMLALGVLFVALSATTDSGWAIAAGAIAVGKR